MSVIDTMLPVPATNGRAVHPRSEREFLYSKAYTRPLLVAREMLNRPGPNCGLKRYVPCIGGLLPTMARVRLIATTLLKLATLESETQVTTVPSAFRAVWSAMATTSLSAGG